MNAYIKNKEMIMKNKMKENFNLMISSNTISKLIEKLNEGNELSMISYYLEELHDFKIWWSSEMKEYRLHLKGAIAPEYWVEPENK